MLSLCLCATFWYITNKWIGNKDFIIKNNAKQENPVFFWMDFFFYYDYSLHYKWLRVHSCISRRFLADSWRHIQGAVNSEVKGGVFVTSNQRRCVCTGCLLHTHSPSRREWGQSQRAAFLPPIKQIIQRDVNVSRAVDLETISSTSWRNGRGEVRPECSGRERPRCWTSTQINYQWK